jgi:itaconyl-CoA hydratase
MTLTGSNNWFEDFSSGQLIRHARGKTMCEQDNVGITLQVLNTAEAHFNEDVMRRNAMGRDGWNSRVQFGGVTIAMVIGMAMQDTGENALAELKLDKIRLKTPVFHGDTLYAFSEVLETRDADRDDAGIVVFRHYGLNQRDQIVFEGERTVLLKRRGSARLQGQQGDN